jgi:two-component system response regulator TctD
MSKPLALVVEDEYDLSVIFTRAAQTSGFEAADVGSGEEALVWLSSRVPDIVILDLSLPGMPGKQVLRQIRSDPRLVGAGVVVVTAHQRLASDVEGEADLVLVKPISYNQLCDTVKHLYASKLQGG